MTGRSRTALTVLLLGALALAGYLRSRSRDGVVVDVDRVVRRASFQSFVSASGEIVATRYAPQLVVKVWPVPRPPRMR